MAEDVKTESRNRLKTAGIIVACGLAGIVAVALGFMLADAVILYAHENSGGQPMLYVMERAEPGESAVVSLTEKDFEEHPALDAVIRGGERNPSAREWGDRSRRVVGGAPVSYAAGRFATPTVRRRILRGADDVASGRGDPVRAASR